MKKLIVAACLALVVAACGGGGSSTDVTNFAPSSAEALAAKPVVADPSLDGQGISVVNTTTAGNQTFGTLGSIGALPDGGYTVAWLDYYANTFLQRYDSAGAKVGGEVSFPALNVTSAVLTDGGLVAAHLYVNVDLQRSAIIVSRFNSGGTLVAQIEVGAMATPSSGPQLGSNVRVAALAGGGFVVGWAVFPVVGVLETQIFVQRFDSQGAPLGDKVQIVGTLSNGSFPSAAGIFSIKPDAQGGFTVSVGRPGVSTSSLVHFDVNGTTTQIAVPGGSTALLLPLEGDRFVLFTTATSGSFSQFLDSAGNPVGGSSPIADMPVDARELADGSFVVLYNTNGSITAQRFDSNGTPVGNLLTLQTSGVIPGVAALADGGFALAWSAPSAAGDLDVFTERFIEVPAQDKAALRAKRKACLNSAKGMTGQDRRAFIDACLAA